VTGAIGGAGAGTGWCRSGAGSLRDHRTDDLIAKPRRLQCNQTISTGVIGSRLILDGQNNHVVSQA